jgi:O-antigen ligase
VLSALLSDAPGAALSASRGLLLMTALWAVSGLLRDARRADGFLTALALLGAAVALVGVLQVTTCPAEPPAWRVAARFYHRCDRARGFFSIYMTQAGVLLLILLATLPRLLPGPPARAWAPAAWVAGAAGLAATLTRGAWVGLAAGALTVLPATRRGRRILVAGALVVALAAVAGPYELAKRLQNTVDPRAEGVAERVYMWRSGLAMWREHPWLGVGPSGVKRHYPRFVQPEALKRRTGHVHNAPLQIMVERGLLGLAAWLWIWVAFYRRAWRAWRGLDPAQGRERALLTGAAAAVTGFVVAGLFEHNFGDAEVALMLWTVMALAFAVDAPGEPA